MVSIFERKELYQGISSEESKITLFFFFFCIAISFTIFVDGNLSTFESHEIADKLEREIEKELDEIYLTVIHVNPI